MMADQPLAIVATGLVTSVGLSTAAACAAMRAGVSNASETHFVDSWGEWIVGHSVSLSEPWQNRIKLGKMAAMAIDECLAEVPRQKWSSIPLLLCVAEQERPGRREGLDDQLFQEVAEELETGFASESAILPWGRVSIGIALAHARRLIHEADTSSVLIAATDSLLSWPTLEAYEKADRLLTGDNSDGFMPGEAAGALLVARPSGKRELLCTGIGFGQEKARIDLDRPLRADGLTQAIKNALADAGRQIHQMDFRVSDLSGEQYYFKEAALALSRTLRQRKEEFDLWHPAEGIGESGAAIGPIIVSVAQVACRKGYACGPNILVHTAGDDGRRTATVLEFGSK